MQTSTAAAVHLLRRASFGPTPALVAAVRRKGAAAWIEEQLHPSRIDDATVDGLMPRWPRLSMSSVRVRTSMEDFGWDAMFDLQAAHMARAIWSNRQLLQVMVDFWTNHLVVPIAGEVWDTAHLYQRDVIRRYALGRYVDLLRAAAMHPSLLVILDNASSTKEAPNENFGRELLELHTVGVGHYTERDVRQAALALTGLTVDWDTGRYAYDADRHHVGPIRVLGWSHANASASGGEAVARSLLAYLARHPRTARRIASKLVTRFVADSPPPALVRTLARVYLEHDTAMVPVLRTLFATRTFRASVGHKTRTPYEDLVATLRTLGIRPDAHGDAGIRGLSWVSQSVGQEPMAWPAPNGYPDLAAAWRGAATTLSRWNFHLCIAAGWWLPELRRPRLRALLPAKLPATYGAFVDALAARVLFHPVTAGQRRALCTFLGHRPGDRLRSDDEALGWRFPYVVALLLDTPDFSVR